MTPGLATRHRAEPQEGWLEAGQGRTVGSHQTYKERFSHTAQCFWRQSEGVRETFRAGQPRDPSCGKATALLWPP